MPTFNGLAGDWKVWQNTENGRYFLVRFVPDSEPPIPMLWDVSTEQLRTLFGPGQAISVDRKLSPDELRRTGALNWGTRDELPQSTEDPFDAWANAVESQAAVRPWLRDPEVLALIASAMLEGREATQAEFEQTGWWQSHSDAQRKWLLLRESDPSTANDTRRDNRQTVSDMMTQAGIANAGTGLTRWLTDQWTTGNWSQEYLTAQISHILDPSYGLDADLKKFLRTRDIDLDPAASARERALVLARTWLGPRAGNLNDNQTERWAQIILSRPDGEGQFVEHLQKRQAALFPEYKDQGLTYEDLAAPWETLWSETLGETADHMDGTMNRLIRTNDVEQAGQILRAKGFASGNQTVRRNFQRDLLASISQVSEPLDTGQL